MNSIILRIFKILAVNIFRNIFICVEELNYMEDYLKVKITEIACKFVVKLLKTKKISGNYQKKETPFSKTYLKESVFTKILRYI